MKETKNISRLDALPNGYSSPLSRVISMKELTVILGLAKSTIYDKLNPKSTRYDPDFPKQIRLGQSRVGWLELDIQNWIMSLK